MNKKTRTVALMLALIVGLVMLFSSVFIAVESHHECDDNRCATCYQIEVCKNVLKTLAEAVLFSAVIAGLTHYFVVYLQALTSGKRIESLVTLKVKLSN